MSDEQPTTPAREARRIDLDAARKARREKRGPAPTIVFLGDEHPLPHDLPAEVIDIVAAVNAGDWSIVTQAVKVLLGGDRYDEIVEKAKAAGEPLELPDVTFLLEEVLDVYEVTLPESKASGWPS